MVDNPTSIELWITHCSMSFNDPAKQQQVDAGKLFSKGYDWITGTEAGIGELLARYLKESADYYDYTFHTYKANWIAIKKALIVPGSYKDGGDTVVDSKLSVGRGRDSNISWSKFRMKNVGRITIMCSHYPRWGRPNANKEYSRNLKWNRKLAHAIGDKAEEVAEGNSLAFYGGDQNIVDKGSDTFFGAPMTSAWDELGTYDNTGHGNIDVIASYNKDGRVKAKSIRALDDEKFHMFTDHFPVEAVYIVQTLR